MGAPVIQDRTLGAFSAWQLKPRRSSRASSRSSTCSPGLAMNVAGASPNPGTPVIVWQPSKVHLNDDVRILLRDLMHVPRSARRSGAPTIPYGVVVESVNVRVLLYAPVRSASVAATGCLNSSVTGSLLTGAA